VKLSEHFTWEEASFSSTALRLGIKNEIPATLSDNVFAAANGMEEVRALLGHPIHVDSWYRSAELNHAVGGAVSSAHLKGYAVDFTCPAFGSPLEICKAIAVSGIRFDQCIQEGRWVHISFDPKARRSLLTARFDANGKATYTGGIS